MYTWQRVQRLQTKVGLILLKSTSIGRGIFQRDGLVRLLFCVVMIHLSATSKQLDTDKTFTAKLSVTYIWVTLNCTLQMINSKKPLLQIMPVCMHEINLNSSLEKCIHTTFVRGKLEYEQDHQYRPK